MRIVSSRGTAFAKGQPNSQWQKNDAELFIPPSLQPVAELPHVINNPAGILTGTSTAIQRDSFVYSNQHTQAGVSAGSVVNVHPFGAGLWHVRGRLFLFYLGAAPTHNISQLELNIPAPGVASWLVAFHSHSFAVTANNVIPFEHVFSFDQDGWFFKSTSGATLAGETLRYSINFEAAKLA